MFAQDGSSNTASKIFGVLCVLLFVGACSTASVGGTPGGGSPAVDAAMPRCGDGVCAGSEIGNCIADCGSSPKCGNGTCESGESTATCPGDCPPVAVCGNGTCESGETTASCAGDCPAQSNCPTDRTGCLVCALVGLLCPSGLDKSSCVGCLLDDGGGACAGGFPDGVCDAGEDATTCPLDCP
ncbi:MAG TPA: hypothetical protein VN253_21305 [Kofleriaceae bacterium]|nr:hypothetical protein [Kofleriaceae bacterium]